MFEFWLDKKMLKFYIIKTLSICENLREYYLQIPYLTFFPILTFLYKMFVLGIS